MKAVRFTEVGAPLVIEDVPRPEPGEDQVLVQVAGCGVCHTDVGFWKDGVPTKKGTPLTLGHEISGTVVESGSQYESLLNREVIIPAVIPCGSCELCREGRGNICRGQMMPGNDIDGGFAEYIVTPGLGLCVVEDRGGYELAELSVIADAVTTPYQAIVRSGLREGDLAIVVGVGGVGTHCVQIAAAFDAHVVAIDVDDKKLRAVADHGAGLTINSAESEFKAIRKQIAGQAKEWGCHGHSWKIFECSGQPGGQDTAFGLLTYASTLLVVGFTLAKREVRLSNLMAFDATVQGTWGCRTELYPEALKMVIEDKVTLKPFIQTYPMSEAPDVIQQVADHKIDKRAILIPDWAA
ncbi:MAG: 6-hydroxycyclohex-1-ene-1-carbonyl-CoA dehydrogenase [Gemmatimonadota bacterium]|nr:MAG: 6-hydroxycyclohex-1-ene-1-carbonyl-CoA dehydrogenase [Gemmatimonadota bacterium]